MEVAGPGGIYCFAKYLSEYTMYTGTTTERLGQITYAAYNELSYNPNKSLWVTILNVQDCSYNDIIQWNFYL